jgi:prophage maintenance system killer protein
LEAFARNHGFVDGNKRTSILMLGVLLINSGYDFQFDAEEAANEAIEAIVVGIVERKITLEQAAKWLKDHIVRV